MSSKQTTQRSANTAAQKTAVSAATKAPRKPKAPAMPFADKFALLEMVKTADASVSDAALAAYISAQLGHNVTRLSITGYRKKFGIASVSAPKPAQLAVYVETLKAALVAHGIAVPAFVESAQTAPVMAD